MKVFIDTNIFIRFFTRDDNEMFEDCKKLLALAEEGKFRPYTSNIVILEILFILTKIYKIPSKYALADIEKLLSLRNLVLIEKTDTKKALEYFSMSNVKFADCLITAQQRKDFVLCTYDKDSKKIYNGNIKTPAEIISLKSV